MNISIVRSSKVAIGTTLILISLNQDWFFASQGFSVLALIAIPFILAGMFDWRPLSVMAGKLKQLIPHPHVSKHAGT